MRAKTAHPLPVAKVKAGTMNGFTFLLELDQQALTMLAHLSGYGMGEIITKHVTREFTEEQWDAFFEALRGPLAGLSKRAADASYLFSNGTLIGRPGYHKDHPEEKALRDEPEHYPYEGGRD